VRSATYDFYGAVAPLYYPRLLPREGLYHGGESLGVCLSAAGGVGPSCGEAHSRVVSAAPAVGNRVFALYAVHLRLYLESQQLPTVSALIELGVSAYHLHYVLPAPHLNPPLKALQRQRALALPSSMISLAFSYTFLPASLALWSMSSTNSTARSLWSLEPFTESQAACAKPSLRILT